MNRDFRTENMIREVCTILSLIVVLVVCTLSSGRAAEIHSAAQSGQSEKVRQLLEQGTDVNTTDNDQRTPLHSAAIGCKVDVAALLLDHGAAKDVQDQYGLTPLSWTVTNCKDDQLAALLLKKGVSANAGFPLHKAAQYGRKDIASLLLRAGADVNARDQYKTTPIDQAISPPRPDMIFFLIENGADYSKGVYVQSFLHWGAAQGLTDLVRLLLEKGGNANQLGALSETPLHSAAKSGKVNVIDLLLQRGANVNVRNYEDETPLHFAAVNGSFPAIQLLIEKGADVNARSTHQGFEARKGQIPLHFAASVGKTEGAALLIDKGSSVMARDDMNRTPLHLAAENGHAAVAEMLVRKGADVTARDKMGNTPSMIAERRQHTPVATILRNIGGGSARRDFDALIEKGTSRSGEYPTGRYVWREDLSTIVQLASAISQTPQIPEDAKRAMEKGQAAFKLAKRPTEFEEAEGYFIKAGRQAPWWPNPYFNLAVTQEKLMKFDDAKFNFENYLIAARNATDANAVRVRIAELDMQKKRHQDFTNEVNSGVAAYHKGSEGYAEAGRRWRKALEVYPDHPQTYRVYANLGDVAMNQSDLDASYTYYQKSFELTPDPSEIPARSVNMGVVLERRGDRAKACAYYKKACDVGDKVGCGNLRNCP